MAKTPPNRLEQVKRYYQKNRDKIRARAKKRYIARTDEQRRKRRIYFRKFALAKRYGITEDDYKRILLEQRGTCALCDAVPSDERTGMLNVDHDHKRNVVRGLLCSQCNMALGRLGDTPSSLLRAFLYVVKYAIH